MRYNNFDPRAAALAAARFHHGMPGEHGHDEHTGRGRGGRGGFGPGFGGFPGGFGPEMMRDFAQAWGGHGRARKGDVRAAILSLLAEAPATGYALIKGIAERTDQTWRPSPGSVYPTLQQLVDEGLVRQQGDGGRTDYELTEEGTAYVAEHKEQLDAAWQTAGPRGGVDQEFMASIGRLFDAVKQFPRSATAEQRAAATAKIDELRRELYRILAD
ncbi:PadR family transcriptional regulator [Lysinimonas soli]|uniref:PadR family transcriptional regulator n=1 Tax=Lysinimonas soli TaxID=1074233 RepID=A0ABW0NTH5_9MICO